MPPDPHYVAARPVARPPQTAQVQPDAVKVMKMFWTFLLFAGMAMMLFQLGAGSGWAKVLGIALAAVVAVAVLVAVALLGRYLLRRFA